MKGTKIWSVLRRLAYVWWAGLCDDDHGDDDGGHDGDLGDGVGNDVDDQIDGDDDDAVGEKCIGLESCGRLQVTDHSLESWADQG